MNTNEKELKKIIEKIYKKQQKEIKSLYKRLSLFINEEIEDKDEDNFNEVDLNNLKKKIKNELKKNNKELKSLIKSNIELIVKNTIKRDKEFYISIDKIYNTNLASKYKVDESKIIKKIFNQIDTGEIYKDNKTLSERIWGNDKKVLSDINKIINQGIKDKKDPLSIAKDLEKYVNPSVKKDFNWNKIYPGTSIRVDYNAQRLSRTSLTHAHQLSTADSVRRNPILNHVQYHSAHNTRTCATCSDRDGMVYHYSDFPLDHPNGNCYMTSYIPENIDELIMDYIMSDYEE